MGFIYLIESVNQIRGRVLLAPVLYDIPDFRKVAGIIRQMFLLVIQTCRTALGHSHFYLPPGFRYNPHGRRHAAVTVRGMPQKLLRLPAQP